MRDIKLPVLPIDAVAPADWLLNNLEGADLDAFTDLMLAIRRADQRKRSDRITDPGRRVLVGPRLPRWMVDRYRDAAREQGVSLYRWATDALEAHLSDQG